MPRPSVALLYPGDRVMRDRADPAESRFAALFEAFASAGVTAVPVVYNDAFAEEAEAQLRDYRLVLVFFAAQQHLMDEPVGIPIDREVPNAKRHIDINLDLSLGVFDQ